MNNIERMQSLLASLGVPARQQSELCAYTLLAMARLRKRTPWTEATGEWTRIHDIIEFIGNAYGRAYAENSRETIRKQAIHHFRTAAFIEDNGTATNSPNYRYRLTADFLGVIHAGGSRSAVGDFLARHESLVCKYALKRSMRQVAITVNGKVLQFSTGKHNELQKAIIEEFGPRFAPGAECLYVGDTTKRDMVKDEAALARLGFEITLHDKMPDVVLYDAAKDWLFFIESVTSVGPMDDKRMVELAALTAGVRSGKIFVTAFPDFKTFKRFSEQLAWETEVWIAEMPDHMIHLNGDKFFGPRPTADK